MVRLVEQLLLLAKTTPDVYFSNFEPINIRQLCQHVISDTIQLILSKQQNITLDCEADFTIDGDATGLTIMISNLLRNASLYTPVNGEICVTITQNYYGLLIKVCDSGPGIPADQRERVFDRFYRVDSDRHNSGNNGSGLGLSIVTHIVELHKATITLGDAALGGLEVAVFFPATDVYTETMTGQTTANHKVLF